MWFLLRLQVLGFFNLQQNVENIDQRGAGAQGDAKGQDQKAQTVDVQPHGELHRIDGFRVGSSVSIRQARQGAPVAVKCFRDVENLL